MTATFHLEDVGGELASALPELAVGPWRRRPGLVAFDAGADRATSLWRVAVARDDDAGHHALLGGERSVADTHALLDDLPDRLERAIDHALAEIARAQRTADPRSAAAAIRESPTWGRTSPAGSPGPVRAAEANLYAALTGGAPLGLDQLAWSAGPAPSEHEGGQLGELLDRVADLARGRARIETRVEGALVAQSVTTLSGDTELWTAPRLSLSGARLHARSVAVAVRTRHAWARIVTLTVRGASLLAVVGAPGGIVSAVPMVWRFVRDVLRELRRGDAALRDAG